jgi:hypothetical protein
MGKSVLTKFVAFEKTMEAVQGVALGRSGVVGRAPSRVRLAGPPSK